MASLFTVLAALGLPGRAEAKAGDQTRIVDSRAAVVRFNAGTYTLNEGAGTVTNQISLIARTRPNAIPPLRGFRVKVSTRVHSASSGDDYGSFSRWVTFSGGILGGNWVAVGNAYESEKRVAVSIVGDHLDEDDETFGLLLSAGNNPLTQIGVAPADLEAASRCTSDGCESLVTIVDDDTRGVTIGQKGMLPVQEGGDATYSVTLDSQPTDGVTVTPEVRNATDADVSVSRALAFTPRNWNQPQMVTVAAAADENRMHGSAVVTHAVSGGDYGEGSVTAAELRVAEQDREADMVHSGDVTIEAKHPTALQRIDDLVFTVTRTVAADYDLEVPVTLSAGIFAANDLSHTVTIGANEYSGEFRIDTHFLDPAAATGDVTATIGDGNLHDVGDPASASVRVHVGETLVTVRFSAGTYTLVESVGTTTDEISLVAQTEPGVPAPNSNAAVLVLSEDGTADPDDYALGGALFYLGSQRGASWTAVGDAYRLEIRVPVSIRDDTLVEGDETFQLTVNRVLGAAGTLAVVPADPTAPPCDSDGCSAEVTIADNDSRGVTIGHTGALSVEEGGTAAYTVVLDSEPTGDVTVTPEVQGARNADISVSGSLTFTPQDWSAPQTVTVTAGADDNAVNGSATIAHTATGADYESNGVTAASVPVAEQDAESSAVVVSLVHVPDGTVIPDNSTVLAGATVVDGSTFSEDEQVYFRLLFSAADGGPAPGGADVELSFEWTHYSPIVPTSGQISRVVLSLLRVDVWDSAVQILDNDIGNPDSTLRVRITGCERNGCVIGDASEITVTIADDDGGPAAAPPDRPDPPRLVCASAGDGYDPSSIATNWQAPTFVGGAPVEDYDVQYSRRNSQSGDTWSWDVWQAWPHTGTATSTTITGLDADVLHGVRVRAVNANGPGQWSLPGTFWAGHSQDGCEIIDELTPGS